MPKTLHADNEQYLVIKDPLPPIGVDDFNTFNKGTVAFARLSLPDEVARRERYRAWICAALEEWHVTDAQGSWHDGLATSDAVGALDYALIGWICECLIDTMFEIPLASSA